MNDGQGGSARGDGQQFGRKVDQFVLDHLRSAPGITRALMLFGRLNGKAWQPVPREAK